jgi:hypothetical protein
VKNEPRRGYRFFLIAMIGALLLPAPSALADSTVQDSLLITASVASKIVADVPGFSSKCTLLEPDNHHRYGTGNSRAVAGSTSGHNNRGGGHDDHDRDRDRNRHHGPLYCVLKAPVLLHVLSNEQWSVTLKAVDSGSSRAPSVAACSLRYSSVKPVRYREAASSSLVTRNLSYWLKHQSAGEHTAGLYLILEIPEKSKISRFSANLTLTVTQNHSGLQYSLIIPITFRYW